MVVGAENYCMVCKKIVSNCAIHECPIKRQTLADSILFGIVDRLYNLGLEPVMAIYSFNSIGNAPDKCHPNIIIQLSEGLRCAILGELPVGWVYGWENGLAYSLCFTDCCIYDDAEDAMKCLKKVIKGFEEFLDTRDIESTRAIVLLTAG